MITMMQNMLADHFMGTDISPQAGISFTESAILTIYHSDMSGARLVSQEVMPDGSAWTLVYMDREHIYSILSTAVAMAGLGVSNEVVASFSLEAVIESNFEWARAQEPRVWDYDN
jgi:hypothetical protein